MHGGGRGSWGNKGEVGYYIGPSMDSYRVWGPYVPDTGLHAMASGQGPGMAPTMPVGGVVQEPLGWVGWGLMGLFVLLLRMAIRVDCSLLHWRMSYIGLG